MKIILDRRIVENRWTTLSDDAALLPGQALIVTLARWQAEHDALAAHDAPIGVQIPNTADLAEVWPLLDGRPLIAVDFPVFGDGRALSQARLLRERYKYAGDILATGTVVRDQMYELQRCGVNAMLPRADQDLARCLAGMDDFTEPYQTAADQVQPIYRRRAAAP